MSYRVRFTEEAEEDLLRLVDFWLDRGEGDVAERAHAAILDGLRILETAPFTCRKAPLDPPDPLLRELVISFGNAGYVALFRIEAPDTVTVAAVRHQREDDYY